VDKVRGDLHPGSTFTRHHTDSGQTPILKVPQTPLDELEAVLRRSTAKISTLDLRHRQTAQGCGPSGDSSMNTSTYHENIKFLICQPARIAFHLFHHKRSEM
jgi:hypothetical protein